MARTLLPAIAIVLAGCGRRSEPAAPGKDAGVAAPTIPALASGRLGDDADVAQLEETYLVRLRGASATRCPHPIPRDPTTSDAADDLRRALGLDGGEVALCLGDLGRLGDAVTGGLAQCDMDPDGAGPGRRVCVAPPLAAPDAAVSDLIQRCATPVRTALAAAAGHGDACSPWLPGRGPDVDLVGLVRVGNLAMLDARERARTGDAAGAIDELIDALAIAQDLSRQGDLVPAITAIAVTPRMIATTERILADVDLPSGGADRLATEVDRLIAAAPDWSDATASEDLAEVLATAWPYREPYAAPPGGARAPQAPGDADLGGATRREMYGAELTAIARATTERKAGCDGKPIADCITGMRALDSGSAPLGEAQRRTLVAVALQSPRPPDQVRTALVGQLAATLHARVADYVVLHALRLAQLGALRLDLELARRHGRGCADDATLHAAAAVTPLGRFGLDLTLARRGDQIVVRGPDILGGTAPVVATLATCSAM